MKKLLALLLLFPFAALAASPDSDILWQTKEVWPIYVEIG